jgi:hypothetical protein
VAGRTNGSRVTTTGTDEEVPPGVLLTMSPPKMPTNRTASHIVMIERPAHNAGARSQGWDDVLNGVE